MTQRIKRYLLVASTALMLFVPTVGITAMASAACTGVSSSVETGVNFATSGTTNQGTNPDYCSSSNADAGAIKTLAGKITNIFSIIVGAASVIMIIYGGFRYITSGGESGRVGAAKNALLYAIVGLIIVALAQLIIHFVLSQTSTTLGN